MSHYITVRNLTCTYNKVTALRDISVKFERGTVTALIGGNGSGKSTLLEAIAGTLTPVAGTIEGVPDNVAFVPQRSRVPEQLPVTVRATAEMGRWRDRGLFGRLSNKDRELVDATLARLSIDDLAGRTLSELSGGQRQRALIAQGLTQQAPLLLLDEPLAGLDTHATDLINQVIDRERDHGTTVILATHDPGQAARADQVITLERGEVQTG